MKVLKKRNGERNKKRKLMVWLWTIFFCLCFAAGSRMTAKAACPSGINNNGLGGIYIDINSAIYNDSRWRTHGDPYGRYGCTWFVGARVMELTGKGSYNTQAPANWMSYGAGLGFRTGQTIAEKAVACYSNHVAFVEKIVGNTVYISEGGQTYYSDSAHGYACIRTKTIAEVTSYDPYGGGSFLGFVYLGDVDQAPQGKLEITNGGNGTVRVAGWAFDPDTPTQPIAIHVYIGGNSGNSSAECHGIEANLSRPDVGSAFQNLGIGNNHGFDATIKTNKTGTQPIYIYAINSKYGGNNPQIGQGTVTISKNTDTSKPTISNVKITNITAAGYTVSCTVTDNVGVTKVQFPTWRRRDTSEGCTWYDGVKNGSTWSFTFEDAEYSDEYMTHIYAYDAAGNSSSAKCDAVYCTQTGAVPAIINGGIYVVRERNSREWIVMDYSNSSKVTRRSYDENASSQKFKIEEVKDGYYRLIAVDSGKVLAVAGESANYGSNLVLADWKGTDGQLFKFNHSQNEYYYMISKLGPYISRVNGGDPATGTRNGGVMTMSWKLEFIKCTAHSWDNGTVTTKATCTTAGVKTYHCKHCSAAKTEAIPAAGHGAGTWKVTKAATCTQTGTKAYVCSVCGGTIRSEGIPAAGHTYRTVTDKAATCMAAGSRHKECSVCGYKAGSETIPAKGHGTGTWKVTKAASCTQAGTKAYVCGICGGTIRNESISATGHTYRVVTDKKTTCTAAGSRHKECDVCGHKAGSETIAAAGHQYGAYQVTKKATISSTGIKKRTCKVCKESEAKRISKLKASIKVEKTKLSVGVKKTVPAPKVTYQRGDKIQSWKSANKAIATVSKSGRITGKKAGTTTITVRLKSGKTAKIKVTVKKTVTPKIKLNRTKVTLKKGKAYSLKISVTPQSIRNKIKFTSSNKKVAVVSSKGKITAKRRGSATVKVYYGKVSAKCRVTVK